MVRVSAAQMTDYEVDARCTSMSNEMMSQNEWVTTLSLVSLVYWCEDIHPWPWSQQRLVERVSNPGVGEGSDDVFDLGQ